MSRCLRSWSIAKRIIEKILFTVVTASVVMNMSVKNDGYFT